MSKTGIYRIRHVDSGKCYVGSCASPQGFRVRWNNHTKNLRKNQHHSPHLQRAWNKYGADSFVFEILLYCDPKDCIMYEQIALDHYKPEYNVCPIAGNSLGYKHTDEDKARMSKIAKKRLQDPTRHPMYGKRGTKSPLFNASRRDGIMIGGQTLAEACRERDIPYWTVYRRMKVYGWSPERAISTPIGNQGRKK